jgi:hypothetical protein
MTERVGGALLSLVFARGKRPTVQNLTELQALPGLRGFAVTHSADDAAAAWAELLASGLAFDCRGLAEGPPAKTPVTGHRLGLDQFPVGEAIALVPGPHIAGGANLPPVVRALAGLGADLARLPDVQAVCWEPANCWMAPDYFNRIVDDWLAGGPFPALGLTMLQRSADGQIETQGLAFFIGQEFRIEPPHSASPDRVAQIAVRLINELIANGAQHDLRDFAFDGFPPIRVFPRDGGKILHVTVLPEPR